MKGLLLGHVFLYNGQKYYTETGVRNIAPMYFTAIIKDGKVQLHQDDPIQYGNLKGMFK